MCIRDRYQRRVHGGNLLSMNVQRTSALREACMQPVESIYLDQATAQPNRVPTNMVPSQKQSRRIVAYSDPFNAGAAIPISTQVQATTLYGGMPITYTGQVIPQSPTVLHGYNQAIPLVVTPPTTVNSSPSHRQQRPATPVNTPPPQQIQQMQQTPQAQPNQDQVIADLRKRIEQLQVENAKIARIPELESDVALLRQEISRRVMDEAEKARLFEEEKRVLQAELEIARQENAYRDSMKRQVEDMQKNLETSKNEIERLTFRLGAEAAETRLKLVDAEREIARLHEECNDLNNQLARSKQRIANLDDDNMRLRQEAARLDEERVVSGQKIDEDARVLRKTVNELREEVDRARFAQQMTEQKMAAEIQEMRRLAREKEDELRRAKQESDLAAQRSTFEANELRSQVEEVRATAIYPANDEANRLRADLHELGQRYQIDNVLVGTELERLHLVKSELLGKMSEELDAYDVELARKEQIIEDLERQLANYNGVHENTKPQYA
eukprot:TRINITY_DN6156_c0_g1_i2.p1 TRINITY_DN6156_c0_g1~~TRINITY_DN6156_c0_g1_i2.p1  ORF type:complete len:499 (+),score=148.67 TRINITY_DN6156_c0_g1_i2:64-1560(+)